MQPAHCPRCGDSLPPVFEPSRGRRRVWCSDGCRRAAHNERQAAQRAGLAVKVVEVPRATPTVQVPVIVPRDLTSNELAVQALDNPQALRFLLQQLTEQASKKKLDKSVRTEALALARVLLPGDASRY